MSDIEEGERYAKSPLTGNWYCVTKWEMQNEDDGQIVAHEKTPVAEEDVPKEWVTAITEQMG